jgi:dTMP kinase
LQPDLTILLDSDPAMSLGRARRRNQRASHGAGKHAGKHHSDENRFEQQSRAFFARVREGYLAIAAREPGRVVVVNASGTPQQTHRKILEVLQRKLKLGVG